MDTTTEESSSTARRVEWFAVPNNKQLTTLGLGGPHVFGLMENNTFELRGETSGNVIISPAQINRVRVGVYETKNGRIFFTRMWTTLSDEPVYLQPTPQSRRGYTRVMRAFAATMLASERKHVIETGSTKLDALLAPLLLGVLSISAMFVAIFVLTNEPWWGRLIVPVLPTIVCGVLTWVAVTRSWPRVLTHVGQLSKQLPKID